MNPDLMYQFSHLGRPIDQNYRTNVLISILVPVSGIIAFILALLAEMDFTNALLAGFFTAASTFITWAIGRELDPDHDWSAFIGIVLVWLAMVAYRAPVLGLLSLPMLIGAMRLTNRTVGPPALMFDSALFLLGIIVVAFLGQWIVAVIGVLALLLDGVLVQTVRRHLLFAAVAAVLVALRVAILGLTETFGLSGLHVIGVIVITLLFFLTIAATRTVKAETDVEGYQLDIRRVRAGMILGLACALVSALWNGDQGIIWLLPLWSSMLGAALYRLPVTVREWMAYRRAKAEQG
jgi:hypothetical protein